MQSFVEFSSVVDSVRSNAGSALKSVQRQIEETALKAAGLGEDEEALYRLNKNMQAYLRAADAMQQASQTLADDFADATEDLALRDLVRKFRDSIKMTSAQQLTALNKELAEPVLRACEADNYATRQRLVGKAFAGLLGANLESFRAASASVEKLHNKVQAALECVARSRAMPEPALRQTPTAMTRAMTEPALAQTAPTKGVIEDLIGGMESNFAAAPAAPSVQAPAIDLLDFGLGVPTVPSGGYANSTPSVRPATYCSASSAPLDLDFAATAPVVSAAAPPTGAGCCLDGMYWPSKEDEDESCIASRVAAWQRDKKLPAMLVTLHEVAPSSAGWVPVKLDDVVQPADVKSVYRKAVLAVHPDKLQGNKGEKFLGHLVFQALCDQWNLYRA